LANKESVYRQEGWNTELRAPALAGLLRCRSSR